MYHSRTFRYHSRGFRYHSRGQFKGERGGETTPVHVRYVNVALLDARGEGGESEGMVLVVQRDDDWRASEVDLKIMFNAKFEKY